MSLNLVQARPDNEMKTVHLRDKAEFRSAFKVYDNILGKEIRFRYSPSVRGEARALTYKDEIQVGDKFFDLPDDTKEYILMHERGHFFEDEILKDDNFWLVSDSGIFGEGKTTKAGKSIYEGILGTFSTDEAVAEAFAAYETDPEWLKDKYPNAYKFLEAIGKGSTVSEAIEIAKRAHEHHDAAKPTFDDMPLKARYGGFTTFNGKSKESYYLNFNRDEIFKALIASEGHFRNFTSLKEDTAGFLGCCVKHLADCESHADEAVSHALIAEDAETSRKFMELRDDIRKLRKWIQSSPITRDEGIREIRKLRRRFESFNTAYDVSKCETCGDPAEIMEDITKIISELKNNAQVMAAHEPEADEFIRMEREIAEKLIAKLSQKYGVEPPEIVISDECHAPHVGLYREGKIMMCQSGVNLHVLAHEFWHHVQAKNGMHMDEDDAEKFAVEFFAAPHQKTLYANHKHSNNESKMAKNLKDVGVIYGGQHAGKLLEMGLQWVDVQRPEGLLGQPYSLWGDLVGTVGGIIGALKLKAPWDLLAALVGGHMSTDLWRHAARAFPAGLPLATPPTLVYTPPPQAPIVVRPTPVVPSGTYAVTGR